MSEIVSHGAGPLRANFWHFIAIHPSFTTPFIHHSVPLPLAFHPSSRFPPCPLPACFLSPLSALWWLQDVDTLEGNEWSQPIIMLISSLAGCLCAYPHMAKFDYGWYRSYGTFYFGAEGHLMLGRRFVGMNDSECKAIPDHTRLLL